MKKLLFILIISNFFMSNAQDKCDCLTNLNHLTSKVSLNYAGYKDKVNAKTENSYNKLVDSLRTATSKSQNLRNCYDILEKYRLFFYDKHLQLNADLPPEVNKETGESNTPTITNWNKKSIDAYLKTKKLNPIG
jgi:hypothetical protein